MSSPNNFTLEQLGKRASFALKFGFIAEKFAQAYGARGGNFDVRGSPRRAHDTQAASAIGSDLVPTKTGQPAAHGGHSRARRGRTVKMKIPVLFPLGRLAAVP